MEESVAGARGREAEYEEALALQGLARIGAIEGSRTRPSSRRVTARSSSASGW